MKILRYLLILTLFSCGGGEGDGAGGGGGSNTDPNLSTDYGKGSSFETLAKFKKAVTNGQWGQHQFFSNFNHYKFKYIDPKAGQNCTGSTFKLCFNFGFTPPPTIHTTTELKGHITNPLPIGSTIVSIVNQANTNNSYYSNGYWVIQINSATYVFSPEYPLGANPIYYKNSSGKEYSLSNYEYGNQ